MPKTSTKAGALIRSAHIEPTIAVTALTALLALAEGLGATRLAEVATAVFAGQLVIGWSNDLLDADRDTAVHRSDKPLATGEITPKAVAVALGAAGVATLGLSATLGWRSALVHLVLVVGSGIAYNLGLKAKIWSVLPYLVAFGSLPAVVTLAAAPPALPKVWLAAASAALGAAAHFLNTLPDLADDAATNIRGLPHRIGGPRSQAVATVLLLGATVLTVLGPPGPTPLAAWGELLIAAMLAVGAVTGGGRTPFRCCVAIAVLNAMLLVIMAHS